MLATSISHTKKTNNLDKNAPKSQIIRKDILKKYKPFIHIISWHDFLNPNEYQRETTLLVSVKNYMRVSLMYQTKQKLSLIIQTLDKF